MAIINRPLTDADIHEVVAGERVHAIFPNFPPNYTSSIDAALTLVPEGKIWGVGLIVFDEIPPRRAFAANCRRAGYIGPEMPAYDAIGATPAIALTIAALKLRLQSPAGATDQ